VRTFEGKRQRRPAVMAAAGLVAAGVAIAAAIVVLTAGDHGERVVPWLVIGGMIGAYVVMVVAMSPRRASITVEGREVRASWRARPLRVESITAGRWVLAAIDTPTGAMLVLHGDDGARLRIGGQHHDAAGYARDARARSVDFAIDAAPFDELAAMLGVPRGDADSLEVELVRSSQSARGLLGTMAPWLLTIVAVSFLGGGLALSGAGEWIERRPYGTAILGGATVAVVILGIVITMVRSLRAKPPSWIVRATAAGLVLARADGDERARAPWSAVRAEPRRHVTHGRGGTSTVAAIVLAIGDESLTIGAFDMGEPWPDETPRLRRAPPWLAGGAQWSRLIAELRAHGALRA
jgi:hypothetical protein